MAYTIKCESCGKKLLTYETYEIKYGSPLKACRACGREYIDPRYREMVITGFPEKEFKKSTCLIMLIIGVFILWRGIYLFGMRQLNVINELQWVVPAVVTLLGAIFVIGSIVEFIRILSGSKLRKYNRLMEESKKRTQDEGYVYKLKKLGYLRTEDLS